jgi:CRISPR-associated protein (TIGR02584 family)
MLITAGSILETKMVTKDIHLLAMVGLAPAVVSETAWALARTGLRIAAISLVTTATARPVAEACLLGPNGAIAQALEPDPLPSITFYDLSYCGQPVTDITGPSDHEAVVSCLDQLLRTLTSTGQPPVYASLAGGRKTMAAALGLAMARWARPEDRLSHVILAPPYDNQQGFLFPSADNPSEQAALNLIDVPILRLRGLLSDRSSAESTDTIVRLAQIRIDALAPAVLDLSARKLSHNGVTINLRPTTTAIAALLAEAAGSASQGAGPHKLDGRRLVALYSAAGASPEAVAFLHRLSQDGAEPWWREHLSRLRKDLQELDGTLIIVRQGKRPYSQYRFSGVPVTVINAPLN